MSNDFKTLAQKEEIKIEKLGFPNDIKDTLPDEDSHR